MTDLIDENFRLHACQIPEKTKDMQVYHTNNMSYVDSGLSCDTFNIIHLHETRALKKAELEKAIQYFQSIGSDYCLWVSEANLDQETLQLFDQLHLSRQGEEVGMVLDLNDYQPIVQPHHRDIKVVNDQQALMGYAEVISENWEPADPMVLQYYHQTSASYLDTENDIELLLYSEEGKPVSTVELFPTDKKIVGLYGLATKKEFRGKGIGSGMMTFALSRLKAKGYEQVILQASEDGIGIYQKLGFSAYNRYFEYS